MPAVDVQTFSEIVTHTRTEREVPLWQSLRTWWMIVPLLYFATMGDFIVEEGSSVIKTRMGPSSSERLEQILVWLIAIVLMGPRYRQILDAALRYKALSAIVVLAFASIFWSPFPADSIRRATLLGLTFLFGYFVAEKFSSKEQMRLILATGWCAVLLDVILVFAVPHYGLTYAGEWRGIFSSKADMGMFLCFLFSPFPFLKASGILMRFVSVVGVLLCLLSIYMCQSRGGWVLAATFIAYSCVVWVLRNFRSMDALVVASLTVVAAGVIAWLVYLNFDSFAYLIGKDPSLTNRTLIWNAVETAIGRHPILGYGYGGFWNGNQSESYNIVASVGTFITHAHNGYLNVWVQLGSVGLGLFIFTTVKACKDAFKGILVYRSDAALWYFGILLLILVGSIDESFLLNYNALTTILYVVACVGLHKIATRQAFDETR